MVLPWYCQLAALVGLADTRNSLDSQRETLRSACRLRQEKGGGAWCPKNMVTKDIKEYLEVNLRRPRVLTSARTQGRFGNGHGVEYSEEYYFDYWRPGFSEWRRWKNRKAESVSFFFFFFLSPRPTARFAPPLR